MKKNLEAYKVWIEIRVTRALEFIKSETDIPRKESHGEEPGSL